MYLSIILFENNIGSIILFEYNIWNPNFFTGI